MSTPPVFIAFLSPIHPGSLGLVPFTPDLNRIGYFRSRYESKLKGVR
jgi:hypothetical protein